jgi:hypothetical protein
MIIHKLKKVQESHKDEFAAEQKFRSLEEQYQKEIAELKVFYFYYKKIYKHLILKIRCKTRS